MKTKSKLLLALSALTVGTVAAGATGTYAWFTASRTATMTTTVTAMNTRGNLNIAYYTLDDISTAKPSSEEQTSSATYTSSSYLSDVSSKDGTTFYAPIWGADVAPVSYKKTETGYLQFIIEITNGGTTPVDVYFDGQSAEITSGGSNLVKWTRVAINTLSTKTATFPANDIDATGNNTKPGHLVFMNNAGDSSENTKQYVNEIASEEPDGETTYEIKSYTTTDQYYQTVDNIPAIPASSAGSTEDAKKTVPYIGTIDQTGHLYIGVSVWMEGTVVNDQNSASGESVNVILPFVGFDASVGA